MGIRPLLQRCVPCRAPYRYVTYLLTARDRFPEDNRLEAGFSDWAICVLLCVYVRDRERPPYTGLYLHYEKVVGCVCVCVWRGNLSIPSYQELISYLFMYCSIVNIRALCHQTKIS